MIPLSDTVNFTYTAKDAREKFKLNTPNDAAGSASPELPCKPLDSNISTLAENNETNVKSLEVVGASTADIGNPMPLLSPSTGMVDNTAGTVNPTPLLSPLSGMVDNTLPITAGIVNPMPLLSPSSGMADNSAGIMNPMPLLSPLSGMANNTLPITAGIVNPTPLLSPLSGVVDNTICSITATGIKAVQSLGMPVDIRSATTLNDPSALMTPGTSFPSSDVLYEQLLQQTASPLPLLEPPLQSTPAEMTFKVLEKPINQEWNGMNRYVYTPSIGD